MKLNKSCTDCRHKGKSIFKNVIMYTGVFAAGIGVMILLLVLTALIPVSAIQDNMQESAQYLKNCELFGTVIDGAEGSRIDRYADSILLGIAYQYDEENPLESVMMSSYYHTSYLNENDNLYQAVTKHPAANKQYMRYWHGSTVVVRPMLMFMQLKNIYFFNAVMVAILNAALIVMIIRRKAYYAAVGLAVGYIAAAVWFVPYSLEYTWVFIIMPVAAMCAVRSCDKGRWYNIGIIFLLSGMITNYFDFLTTETVTLSVPLLIVICIGMNGRYKESFSPVKIPVKAAVTWTAGYAGTWCAKWITASAVMHTSMLPYVTEHVDERIGGDIGVGTVQYITGAVVNNIKCLFPAGYGKAGVWLFAAVILFIIYIGYVYHSNDICLHSIIIYGIVGLIPYARYLVLHNHSYLHCFFTYRAQIATILAMFLITGSLVDWRWFADGAAKRTKS